MRNKIFDHFLQFSNFSFILGIVITTILVYKNEITNWPTSFTAYIVFMIISLILATIFAIHRRNYFVLIYQHITPKCVNLFKWSVYLLFVNIFISIVMMFLGAILLGNAGQAANQFFKNGYLYIILGIEIVLTMIDVILDAISKLKVKVDLSLKRGGSEALLSEDYTDEKLESNQKSEN